MSSLGVRVVVILWGVVMLGCGMDIGEIAPKATERIFRDGRVYILNNVRPFWYDNDRIFFVLYDGQRFYVPHNMTYDSQPTLAGSTLITPEPLPGGTPLDFEYWVEEQGDVQGRNLSAFLGAPVIIDGDITIEFYNDDLEVTWGIIIPKVILGRSDAPHVYK